MALSGAYTTLDTVLAKVRRDSLINVDEADAIEWVSEILAMFGNSFLKTIVTDGNPIENNPEPLVVSDYRVKLPCDLVEFKYAFDLDSFAKLQATFSETHTVNMTKTPNAANYKKINPEYWKTEGNQYLTNYYQEASYQLKHGYLYTDYPEGKLILVYLGWPMDEDENLLIPADPKVIQAMASKIQYHIDYQLWRSGDISDRVFNDSEQNMLFDIPAAQTHALMPNENQMERISNFIKKNVRTDMYFDTHFNSLGRRDKYRTH